MTDSNYTNPNNDEDELAKSNHELLEPPSKEFIRPVTSPVDSEPNRGLRSVGMAGAISYSLVIPPFVGAGLGYLIDLYFKSYPTGVAIGFLIGVAAGFVQMIHLLHKIEIAEKEEKEEARKHLKPKG